MKSLNTYIIVCLCLGLFASCATQRPVLYPNHTLKEQGGEAAQAAVDECMRLAAEYGAEGSAGSELAKDAAGNAAVAGAAGAAAGAVLGNIGKGAAAGAAGAGAATLASGLFRSNKPDPVFRSFVERCLIEQEYSPIGWK
ncbi:MAG: hypothetical protein ISR96_08035 [Nitrospira sp.]|nr:hypothetical protein [bacterium]MBL7049447.1 hypothetical protein [Nitrospira sp.]